MGIYIFFCLKKFKFLNKFKKLKKGPISKDKAIFKLNTVCGIVETGQPPQGFKILFSLFFW